MCKGELTAPPAPSMKILGIAYFFLAVLCVCTVGENGILTTTIRENVSTSTSVSEAVNGSTSQATTLQVLVLATTAVRATNESITSNSTPPSPNATQQITQDTTTQPPVKATTTLADQSDSTANTTQTSGTQLAQNESLDVSSTKGWSFSSTVFLQKTTSDPGTSGLHVRSPTESTNLVSDSPGSDSGKKAATGIDIHYSSVILPVVITLIVITLSVFSLVALYRICQKKTPERQENGTEQAQSDKEGVKLLSVKTTSSETGYRWMPLGAGEEAGSLVFVEVRDLYEVGFSLPSANLSEPTTPPPSGEVSQGRTTGEHSSQGKNKTRQLFTPQQ